MARIEAYAPTIGELIKCLQEIAAKEGDDLEWHGWDDESLFLTRPEDTRFGKPREEVGVIDSLRSREMEDR